MYELLSIGVRPWWSPCARPEQVRLLSEFVRDNQEAALRLRRQSLRLHLPQAPVVEDAVALSTKASTYQLT